MERDDLDQLFDSLNENFDTQEPQRGTKHGF